MGKPESLVPSPRKYDASVRRYGRVFDLVGLETHQDENAVLDRGALYIFTHRAYTDIPLVAVGLQRSAEKRNIEPTRRLHLMAKQELFKFPLNMRPYIEPRGAFPIDRDTPQPESFYHAVNVLRHDEHVGVFGEGTRGKGDRIKKIKRGSGIIALTAPETAESDPIPIVVVATAGTETTLRDPLPTNLHSVYAEPIYAEEWFPLEAIETRDEQERKRFMRAAGKLSRQIKVVAQEVLDMAYDYRSAG